MGRSLRLHRVLRQSSSSTTMPQLVAWSASNCSGDCAALNRPLRNLVLREVSAFVSSRIAWPPRSRTWRSRRDILLEGLELARPLYPEPHLAKPLGENHSVPACDSGNVRELGRPDRSQGIRQPFLPCAPFDVPVIRSLRCRRAAGRAPRRQTPREDWACPSDRPVFENDGSRGIGGNVRLVRDQHDSSASLIEPLQDCQNLLAGTRVEVARGLVSKYQTGRIDQ